MFPLFRGSFCSLAFLLATLLVMPAQARPITYPGGWSAMSMNDPDMNNVQIYYTLTPKASVGWRHEYWRDPKAHMDAVQVNFLLKRWNGPQSQANLYFKPGMGWAYDVDESEPVIYGGISADWEDRRYYVSYGNEFRSSGDINNKAAHTARIGIAPYVGDYGDLHTWFMLQADYDAGKADDFSVTPLVRFFKGTTLMETGINLDGGVFFHLMQTF